MKMVREEPERPLDQVRADDALEQVVEALDQPLEKVLRAAGHLRHAPRRELREDDQADRDDPGHDHRVGDREPERPGDLDRLLREAVLHGLGQCEVRRVGGSHAWRGSSTVHAMARPRSYRHRPRIRSVDGAPATHRRSERRRSCPPAFRTVLRDAGGFCERGGAIEGRLPLLGGGSRDERSWYACCSSTAPAVSCRERIT